MTKKKAIEQTLSGSPIAESAPEVTVEAIPQDLAAELQSGAPIEKIIEKQEQKCGHVNKQHYNTKGKLEDLACVLKKGHAGNHEAPFKSLANFSGEKDPEEEYLFRNGKWYLVVEDTAVWSDAAGVPTAQIQPDYEGYPDRKSWLDARLRKRNERV